MTLALLEPVGDDQWALTFYLTESGRAEACPRFICTWEEASALVRTIGAVQLGEQLSRRDADTRRPA